MGNFRIKLYHGDITYSSRVWFVFSPCATLGTGGIPVPISDKNTRYLLTLPKELKKQLEEEAKKENRTLNNYILKILMERKRPNSE